MIKIKFIKRLLLFLIILIVIFAGIVCGVAFAKYDGNIKLAMVNIISYFTKDVDTKYVLILGVSEDIDTELTDTMLLAGYNPNSQKAFLVSIPRDTFVGDSKSSASANDKINSKYSKGPENTVKYVENLTGIEIDNHIVIKNSMLIKLVDLIGGVEFDVPIDMKYDDPSQDLHIDLNKGIQKIDGNKAEQLLRFRHNNDGSSYPSSYGDNDEGRMRTTREFIKATLEQVISVKNIPKIKKIINTVSDNLITDLSKDEMISYIVKLAGFDTKNLKSEVLPGEFSKFSRLWFFEADKEKTKELFEECKSFLED